MTFTIKIYQDHKLVTKVLTHKKRRFLKKIRSINWSDSLIKAHVKASDGYFPDNFGKSMEFYNDGDYTNKSDFWLAVDAFLEE